MRSRCGINTLKYRIGWIEKFFDVLTIWLIVFWILVMCQLPITEVTDIHVQIIDESVGGIVNAECVKETYLLDTEDDVSIVAEAGGVGEALVRAQATQPE